MNRCSAISLLLTLLVLAACSSGNGIYGKVTDGEAKKPLQGAVVELLECNAAGCENLVASQTTSSDGRYEFPEATSGKYMLTITWENPPECPGIQPYDTLGTSGEFLVTYAGYGGLGGLGKRSIFALHEFEFKEGENVKLDLELSCP